MAGIVRCIWLLLGTGEGSLKITEAERPPSVSAGLVTGYPRRGLVVVTVTKLLCALSQSRLGSPRQPGPYLGEHLKG